MDKNSKESSRRDCVTEEALSRSLRLVTSILCHSNIIQGAIYEGRFREDLMDGQGTVKIIRPVPGINPGEVLIPLEVRPNDIQSDFYRFKQILGEFTIGQVLEQIAIKSEIIAKMSILSFHFMSHLLVN
jgi:hypothetical protein